MESKDWAQAEKAWKDYLKVLENNLPNDTGRPSQLADTWCKIADCLVKQDKPDKLTEAERYYSAALQVFSRTYPQTENTRDLLKQLVSLQMRLGKPVDAENSYKEVIKGIELAPNFPHDTTGRQALAEVLGNYAEFLSGLPGRAADAETMKKRAETLRTRPAYYVPINRK